MSYPEFAPGVNPSFVLPVKHEWPVSVFNPAKPYDQIIPLGIRPIREYSVAWRGLTRANYDYFNSFFHRIGGPAGVFTWRTTDKIFSPLDLGPVLDESVAGSLSERTYYVKWTWYDSTTAEETEASPSTSNTVAANSVLEVEVPHMPAGVSQWRVYAHETYGSECLQATVSGTRFWTEPVSGMLTGTAQPPSVNTLFPLLRWRVVGAIEYVKYQARRWQVAMTWREVWV